MLQVKDVQSKFGNESVTDVIIFEQGEYRNPLKIITDYEAMHLSISLAGCLSNDKIQMIVDSLTKTLQKGE